MHLAFTSIRSESMRRRVIAACLPMCASEEAGMLMLHSIMTGRNAIVEIQQITEAEHARREARVDAVSPVARTADGLTGQPRASARGAQTVLRS